MESTITVLPKHADLPHPDMTTFRKGCRCAECCQLVIDSRKHGTKIGYERHKCKCDLCRAWNTAKSRKTYLARVHGLTVSEYEAILEAQGSKCAICDRDMVEASKPSLDHNHTTGKIREFLCSTCNTAIGMAHEDPARLRKMADYLERWA